MQCQDGSGTSGGAVSRYTHVIYIEFRGGDTPCIEQLSLMSREAGGPCMTASQSYDMRESESETERDRDSQR